MLTRTLPDVTSDSNADTPLSLQWVGMEEIAVPISIALQQGQLYTTTAKANIFVSLDNPEAKGIHMSRLHSVINQLADHECNQTTIDQLLNDMMQSQQGNSSEAKIQLAFDVLLNKPALISDESGFQSYPVRITAEKLSSGPSYEFEIVIPYSSTCPCSASLARQLQSNAIDREFPDATIDKAALLQWIQSAAGSIATPHSQRSYATIKIAIGKNDWPNLASLIFQFEEVIGTPVQTAVKRRDEQEFARLNASNLMFCEDAARRIKNCLEQMHFIKNYWIKVDHQESLHAHNAVVIDQKRSTDT